MKAVIDVGIDKYIKFDILGNISYVDSLDLATKFESRDDALYAMSLKQHKTIDFLHVVEIGD